jgi:HK97 family phage portal protein
MASVLDRFRNLITKNAQQTAAEYNKAIYQFLGESIVWNPENDDTYIKDGYRKNATIYSIVNIITNAATTIPFQIYEKVNENEVKRYKALTSGSVDANSIYKANLIRKNAMVELEGTELHKLLERPNAAQSYSSWISELIAFGKLTGNRYIYGIAPETGINQGKYKELYVMPSQIMEIVSGGIMQPVQKYRIEYQGAYDIPADDICHIKDFNPYYDGTGSHLYGQSPLRAGLRSLTTNNEAVQTGVKYLQNQTARGILTSDEGDINEVQAQQLKDKFRKNFQGSDNAGDVIITPKKLSWVNFGLNAADVSLIEQYNASIKDLCNIYAVPVQLLNNTESSTYNNMKEAKKALYQNCVIPELNKIRDELNRWLVPKFGDKLFIDFDYSAIPELQEENEKVVDQLSKAWWVTPNEKRRVMNYGVDEENIALDNYYIPANLIPIETNEMPIPDPIDEMDIEEEKQLIKEALWNIQVKSDVFNTKAEVDGMVDTYTTEDEAIARAIELGGDGYHEIELNDEVVYMPFATHQEYEDAIEMQEEQKQVSDAVEAGLKKKVEEHNEEYGDDPSKRVTLGMLIEVFERGVGAYNTNPESVRPSVSSSDQWAYARVNSFLYAMRNEEFRSGKHDTDLFPEGHPLSSKEESKAEMYDDYPQTASNNAKRMLEWREKYGRDVVKGGTEIGWRRASMLSARKPISIDVISRMAQFNRHRENAKIADEYKDEPWKDRGYVAWNLWGGTAGVDWAIKKMEELRNG